MTTAVGTETGAAMISGSGDAQLIGLEGLSVNHVTVVDDAIIAAVPNDGLYRIDEGGTRRLWEGDARSCAASPDGVLYVGIEPAMIFRSRDRGETWERLSAIDALPTRDEWSFPPPPHEPHVLSIDFAPESPQLVMAGVEVGGALWSEDGGDTWEERNEGIYVDVHSLRPDRSPGVLYAVTGSGFYASEDNGRQWERRMEGIGNGYTIGLAAHPERAGDVFISSGDRPPGMNGRLYRSTEGGRSWNELPEPPAGIPGRAPVPFFREGAPHIGDAHGGVFRLDEASGSWVEVCRLPAAITCAYSDGAASSVMH